MDFDLSHIGFSEDCYASWLFYVNDNFLLSLRNGDRSVLQKVSRFYIDYIALSQKYKLGEFIPSFPGYDNSMLADLVVTLSWEFVKNTDSISFFPLFNVKRDTSNKIYKSLLPGSCQYHLINNSGEVCIGYYDINKSRIKPLTEFRSTHLPGKSDNFSIVGSGAKMDRINLADERDIGFSLELHSEFWFEFAKRYEAGNDEKGKSNKLLAYNNTPRFNSYLRDLKNIWVNKYGWNVELSDRWYETDQDGIKLGGKIIYLEDIES